MRLRLHRRAPRLALALCLVAAAHAARAQEPTNATTTLAPPRLVASLEGYEGPSGYGGRPALAEFSPDGRLLALSGEGRTVRLYEVATAKLLLTLAGEKGRGFTGFAFAPDMRVGATRNTFDRSVSLWDLTTGKPLLKLAGRVRDIETKLKSVQNPSLNFVNVPLSPDGRVVLSEREDDIVVAWDASAGKEVFRLEHKTETNAAKDVLGAFFMGGKSRPLMMSAAFSPDGTRVVTANGDTRPKLWDAATGKLVATLANQPYDNVYAAAFLPAAGAVLTVSFDGHVKLWDASTGAHRATLVGKKIVDYFFAFERDGGPVAFTRDGRLVAARAEDVPGDGVKDEVKIWDAADGKVVATIEKNKSKTLAFSPDGATLATGGDERYSARFWDAATGRLKLALARTEGGVRTFTYSPDGRLFVTTSDRGVRLWDALTGAPVATLDKSRYPVRFSPDGRLLVTGGTDKTAYLYEILLK